VAGGLVDGLSDDVVVVGAAVDPVDLLLIDCDVLPSIVGAHP